MKIYLIRPWIIGVIIILSIVLPIQIGANMTDMLVNEENGITREFYDSFSAINLIIPLVYLLWILYNALGLYGIEKRKNGSSGILLFSIFWIILFLLMIVNPLLLNDSFLNQSEYFKTISYILIILSLAINLNYIIRKLIKLEKGKNPIFSEYFSLTLYLIFYPIGCWIIQNRIRTLVIEN